MDKGTRACVAFVVGSVIGSPGRTSVYDYSRSTYIQFGGTVDGENVNVYDHERGCHFSGTLPQVYDYGTGAHVSIEINGSNFSGYDFGAGHHFNGTVNGANVQLYDFDASEYFNFQLRLDGRRGSGCTESSV
ncbi:hypothetical protein [Caballeronia zhejiangensis]|uniref:hypothetical protein n=1 Tax=Caballeronia zhejiangensis TaxID=871203 RepID=UPI0007C6890A|nr:hypothetical protein [Caballeronia zhejiangensis]